MADSYEINDKAAKLAGLLDQGDDNWAANLLRQESQQMSPNDFRALVSRTNQLDNNQVGANLEIYDSGQVHVVGQNGDQIVGQLVNGASQRQNRIFVDNGSGMRPGCYYQDVPVQNGNGNMEGAAISAVVGVIQTGNLQGALYGLQRGMNGGGVHYERRLFCPEQDGNVQPYFQQYQQPQGFYNRGFKR